MENKFRQAIHEANKDIRLTFIKYVCNTLVGNKIFVVLLRYLLTRFRTFK